MTKRNAKSEITKSEFGNSWQGKKGRTDECFIHSLRMNARDLRTSATDMSVIADVTIRSPSVSFACIRLLYLRLKKKMVFDLTKSLNALPDDERAIASQRIELVHAAQRRMGMEPRNDSQLTFNYATGTLADDDVPSAIANELLIVDRIFNSTIYASILEDTMRELAHHFKYKYHLSWNDTWELVRFYGPTMVKLYCAKTIVSAPA